jgi:chemotaxis methyl-accepting protein methylase
MEEIKYDLHEKVDYRIFASDKSQKNVSEAQKGEYPSESLNNLNLHRLNQWFTKDGDIYKVKPGLKKNIDFSVFDLFNEHLSCPPSSIFGDFDLVICANLFFYYKTEFRQILLEKTAASMTNEGYFITGETERDILIGNHYHEVYPYSAIFRNKGNYNNRI